MASLRLILLFCALFGQSVLGVLYPKDLAGPPSEFSEFVLPSTKSGAINQKSAQYYLQFKSDEANPLRSTWSSQLPVDSDEAFAFAIFTPYDDLQVSLEDPNGNPVDLSQHEHNGPYSAFPIGQESLPGVVYTFEAPFSKGVYQVHISTSSKRQEKFAQRRARTTEEADGLLIWFNKSPVRIHSYLSTYDLQEGQQIGLVTRVTNDVEGIFDPRPLNNSIYKAIMEVYDPSGDEIEVQMHDDGLHGDELANDGIYGAQLPASEVGFYRAEAYVEGMHSDGTPFVRSTQHILPVVPDELTLLGSANAHKEDQTHVAIDIAVDANSIMLPLDMKFRVYAEVWGKDSNNEDAAICWLSKMTPVKNSNGQHVLTLVMDNRWALRAGAMGPLTLKNVIVQDSSMHIPISTMDSIPVTSSHYVLPMVQVPMDLEITREMRYGVRPAALVNKTRAEGVPSIMLVHGYCSDVNPWKEKGDFTDGAFFIEPKASLTNDKFAQLVIEHADELGMTSWSGVGHSQGGIVLLHILNYYHSGMDEATNGRKIQSVGTPYLGNSGAGSAANLVKIFGYGCGENFDLTVDGSTLWLAGITAEHKQEVFFYTTTYQQGKLFGDYCNLAVNLVLEWPNDGTSELVNTKLPGATNCGNVQKWCHTTEMAYDAQYYDQTRNKEMNTKAAR